MIGWIWLLLVVPVEADSRYHTSPYCWESPRLYHEPEPSSSKPHRPLQLERLDEPWPGGGVLSHHQAYAAQRRTVSVEGRGTDDGGILIYNERPYLLYLPLDDHRGLGQPTWINEKWVYVRVWWGRILGTDVIIDVERERIVTWDDVHFGSIAWTPNQQCELPEWNETIDSCSCYAGADRAWRPLRLEEDTKTEDSVAPPTAERSAPCDGAGQVFFSCSLTDGGQVEACGLPGGEGGTLELQVRLSRGGETVWRWPEVVDEKQAVPSVFFEQQNHVRSVSYHLWFQRGDVVVDLVDHWTEGSHDSHFAGLVFLNEASDGRRQVACEEIDRVIDLAALADRLPHRAVPVG